ncbi:MFS transporter [Actinosynnema pretiosum subsp. pretiosum]|uniref:Major facilitator superfamily MFS_1 n=2 Tax=Actinosynnema TaxID=40566 RepID=C6WMW6_ACTMD|nr:MFS transporter [Actinosynnema mirum]ACU38479.1 major facilitator superfamily MFS_1 [Actinosynnema mirum DSM 43827]AXX32027.1 Transporter, MFS superfamily [Actinosynnema pretiosum subsp. pretiosum]QUF04004.1 MFS transporter [Actinosynnema pretiosum subsp. pretiosum]
MSGTPRIAGGITAFAIFATAVSFVISMAGSSMKSTVQVLFLPMVDSFDVTRGTLAVGTTLFAVVTALASSAVGHLADRIGAVPVLAMGAGIVGCVLLICGTVTDIRLFVLAYGVLGAIGCTMLSFVPLGVLADQLFAGRNAGVLYAVLTNGAAVGFMVLVPLWTYLGGITDWRQILLGAGAVFLVVLLPLSLLLVRSSTRQPKPPAAPAEHGFLAGVRTAFADRRVRGLILPFFACGTTMAFVDVHLFPHMHDHGVAPVTSSVAFVLLGATEIAGSLVAGRLCDRGRIRATLVGGYLMRAGAMVLTPFFSAEFTVLVFGAVFGASYLVTVVATTMWIAKILPRGRKGTAIGVLWALHMVAVAVSSQLGAVIADRFHSYLPVILLSAVMTVGAALLVSLQPDPDAVGPEVSRTPAAA